MRFFFSFELLKQAPYKQHTETLKRFYRLVIEECEKVKLEILRKALPSEKITQPTAQTNYGGKQKIEENNARQACMGMKWRVNVYQCAMY